MDEQNFRDKYEKAGAIGGLLIERFYASLSRLIAAVDPAPRTAFEVGAGEGFSTQYLSRLLPTGCAFSSSEHEAALVERARVRNPGVPFEQQSVYALTRGDAAADLVVCLEVLEHLEDPEHGLAELARVTGRALIVSVPNEPLWRALNCARLKYIADLGNTPGHLNHWTPWAFERFVGRRLRVLRRVQSLPWTLVLAEPRR
jgi:SAM-dependent methyltransferase